MRIGAGLSWQVGFIPQVLFSLTFPLLSNEKQKGKESGHPLEVPVKTQKSAMIMDGLAPI
jgi:hypothetical protein